MGGLRLKSSTQGNPIRRQPYRETSGSNLRGLQIPKSENHNRETLTVPMHLKVDWLAFTISEDLDTIRSKKFSVLSELGYDLELFEKVAGKNFYNAGYSLGGFVKVFYNDVHLERQKGASNTHDYIFTGVGCTDLAAKISGDWISLFKKLKEFGVKFRRIDLALDDMSATPRVDFPKIERKLKAGEYKSSKRHYNILRDVNTSGDLIGETVYIGSRKTGSIGHSILRTYQKYLQMVSKHQESQMPIEALASGSWIRWELEITKQKAISMIDLIIERNSISDAYYSVLRDIIDFKIPTKNKNGTIHKNKSRWKSCKWWVDFLNDAKSAKLQDPEKVFDIATALNWIYLSVRPTLQMLNKIYSDRFDYDFYDILRDLSQAKFSKKQKRVLLESQFMDDKTLRSYLNQFIRGGVADDK